MKLKSHIRLIVIITALLHIAARGYSQNYSQDMEKIMNAYKHGSVSFHMKYRFYPYDSIRKVTDSMNAFCSMSGVAYYYKIESGKKEYEYVRNSDYYFVVDHSLHAIAVKKGTDAKGQAWDISKIDSLMHSRFSKVTYKDAGKNEGEYEVNLIEGTWNRFKIVFDKSSSRIVRIYMYSSMKGKMFGQSYSNPMISIYYSEYSGKALDKSIFSESKFFTVASNTITPAEDYKKYKVLNYLKKQS